MPNPGRTAITTTDEPRRWRVQGQAVRHFRELLGLTQRELGVRMGVHDSVVCKIEKGSYIPGLRRISLLANALGVSVGAIAYPVPTSSGGDDEVVA